MYDDDDAAMMIVLLLFDALLIPGARDLYKHVRRCVGHQSSLRRLTPDVDRTDSVSRLIQSTLYTTVLHGKRAASIQLQTVAAAPPPDLTND